MRSCQLQRYPFASRNDAVSVGTYIDCAARAASSGVNPIARVPGFIMWRMVYGTAKVAARMGWDSLGLAQGTQWIGLRQAGAALVVQTTPD